MYILFAFLNVVLIYLIVILAMLISTWVIIPGMILFLLLQWFRDPIFGKETFARNSNI